jgi:putative two-component system response regulator
MYAYEMLSPIGYLRPALDIPYCHHEKWDGTGYPQGLRGDDIPISARLMALADVYDALISKRVYKAAMTHEQAVAILAKGRGAHFDPDMLDAFLQCHEDFREIARQYADEAQ